MNYELIDETKTDTDGTELFRIKATKDFRDVKKGDIGGWVSKNVTIQDNAWVYDNAIVRDRAEIMDSAIIRDNAIIKGNAIIRDNAIVKGNAIVKDDSWVRYNVIIRDNAMISGHSVINGYSVIRGNALIVNIEIPYFRVYKYYANPIPSKEGNLVRLGCFVKNRENWIIEFWDNEEEFPMHSDESKDRLKALNMCLVWYGEELIKYEDLL